MNEVANGIIEVYKKTTTKNGKDMWLLTLDGNRKFSSFNVLKSGEREAKEGDHVRVVYLENKGYKNVKSIEFLDDLKVDVYPEPVSANKIKTSNKMLDMDLYFDDVALVVNRIESITGVSIKDRPEIIQMMDTILITLDRKGLI